MKKTKKKVLAGYRLPPPPNSDPAIADLMKQCMSVPSDSRPTFLTIYKQIEKLEAKYRSSKEAEMRMQRLFTFFKPLGPSAISTSESEEDGSYVDTLNNGQNASSDPRNRSKSVS